MPTCNDCFYARDIGNENAVACHRYPPTVTAAVGNNVTAHFPLLSNLAWCGEWRQGVAVNQMALPRDGRAVSKTQSNRRRPS